MSSQEINPEWKLVPIGRGSFATVSILSGRPVAFKHVILHERRQELKAEFEALCRLFDLCNTHPFFAIPRPLAYLDSSTPGIFVSASRSAPPVVSEEDFRALQLDSAAYAMDQVLPLPLSTALVIRRLFYPPGQETATVPSLCRLYFGKVLDSPRLGTRPRFFNSANFPLDVSRYRRMLESRNGAVYPAIDDIAYGMGEMLGRLHWLGGYDGRDVEFVMGGASFSGVKMAIIDFNQVREWSRRRDRARWLEEAFFQNDPYYPRPRSRDPLYQKFQLGYLDACKHSHGDVELAENFLRAIETEQAKRDSAA